MGKCKVNIMEPENLKKTTTKIRKYFKTQDESSNAKDARVTAGCQLRDCCQLSYTKYFVATINRYICFCSANNFSVTPSPVPPNTPIRKIRSLAKRK